MTSQVRHSLLILVLLLQEHAKQFGQALAEFAEAEGFEVDQSHAQFEATAYLTFRICNALASTAAGQDEAVCQDMCGMAEQVLITDAASSQQGDLNDVFQNRIVRYGRLWTSAVEAKGSATAKCVEELWFMIRASLVDGQIPLNPPYNVTGGLIKFQRGLPTLLQMDLRHAGTLDCIVAGMCRRSQDIRDLSEAEAGIAAIEGQVVADRLLSRSVKALRKKWWQVWR